MTFRVTPNVKLKTDAAAGTILRPSLPPITPDWPDSMAMMPRGSGRCGSSTELESTPEPWSAGG